MLYRYLTARLAVQVITRATSGQGFHVGRALSVGAQAITNLALSDRQVPHLGIVNQCLLNANTQRTDASQEKAFRPVLLQFPELLPVLAYPACFLGSFSHLSGLLWYLRMFGCTFQGLCAASFSVALVAFCGATDFLRLPAGTKNPARGPGLRWIKLMGLHASSCSFHHVFKISRHIILT